MINNNLKCVVCLPVMNCSDFLPYIFKNLVIIKSLFVELVIIFGYDNSNDNTLELINNFKNNYNDIKIHIIKNKNRRYRYRTHNLEYIRNTMLEFTVQNYSHFDFYIAMDSDDVNKNPIKIDILQKHISNFDKWDILTFNKVDYYDIWALQFDKIIHHVRCFGTNSGFVVDFVKNLIKSKLNKLNESEYLPVYSAFNGFGIYKMNVIADSNYNGKTQSYFPTERVNKMIDYVNENVKNKRKSIELKPNKENCEHIGFHMNIIKKNPTVKIMITRDILFN